jgi:hypothetical protein
MQDFKTKVVNFRATPERFATLKAEVEKRKPFVKSVSEMIERALMSYLEQGLDANLEPKPKAAAATMDDAAFTKPNGKLFDDDAYSTVTPSTRRKQKLPSKREKKKSKSKAK